MLKATEYIRKESKNGRKNKNSKRTSKKVIKNKNNYLFNFNFNWINNFINCYKEINKIMNIKENKKCELRVCINKVWKECINKSTKTIKYKNWSIPYLICNSCYDKLPKYLKQTAKII